jgi:hypothetical protein
LFPESGRRPPNFTRLRFRLVITILSGATSTAAVPKEMTVALIDLNDAERAAFGRVNGLNLSPLQD